MRVLSVFASNAVLVCFPKFAVAVLTFKIHSEWHAGQLCHPGGVVKPPTILSREHMLELGSVAPAQFEAMSAVMS